MLWPQPEAAASWTGNLVGGSNVALTPRISPDGKSLAFLALVEGVSQVGVLNPNSGNWTMLTKDRTRGYVGTLSWSLDGTRIYFTRMQGTPLGVYSVPALGGDERLVVENAKGGEPLTRWKPDRLACCQPASTNPQVLAGERPTRGSSRNHSSGRRPIPGSVASRRIGSRFLGTFRR